MLSQMQKLFVFDKDNRVLYDGLMKKQNALDGLVRGRSRFVLNQKIAVFADKRTKRNKSRAEQKRRALSEQDLTK